MTTAYQYANGRPMRAGVRADGTYLDNIHGRTAKAFDTQSDDVRAAVVLFGDWSGRKITATDARRLAHLVGCGLSPSSAASRELGYRLWLAISIAPYRHTMPCGIGL